MELGWGDNELAIGPEYQILDVDHDNYPDLTGIKAMSEEGYAVGLRAVIPLFGKKLYQSAFRLTVSAGRVITDLAYDFTANDGTIEKVQVRLNGGYYNVVFGYLFYLGNLNLGLGLGFANYSPRTGKTPADEDFESPIDDHGNILIDFGIGYSF